MKNHKWRGGWELVRENWTLEHMPSTYYVDLETCKSSAQVMDWIFQIVGKSWADAEVMLGLLEALDDVLRPQSNLCSGGASSVIDPVEVITVNLERGFHSTVRV